MPTFVVFFIVLIVLVLIHELGHFIAAKWAKMQVDEFAFGFPPRLFSYKKGGTEYSFNLLPLGGYVKILGENGDKPENKNSKSFSSAPKYKQIIVLAVFLLSFSYFLVLSLALKMQI